MTDYTTHTQTLTNGNNATIVSPIDPSGSPKTEQSKSKSKKRPVKKVTTVDFYQTVTDRIIEALEQGVKPWVCPWDKTFNGGLPMNFQSKKSYNGVNIMLLWMSASAQGFQRCEWLTYKQAQELGGQVRKGEKGTQITFYKTLEIEKENQKGEKETDKIPMLKTFTVFNVEQIDGLTLPPLPTTQENDEENGGFEALEHVETFIKNTEAKLTERGVQAFFCPSTDEVVMPTRDRFTKAADFYATALHELTHWTGGKKRLDRKQSGGFGSQDYAFEELIAELGSAFAIADLGVIGEYQHDSYIESWLTALKGDKRYIFKAAAQASKAHQFLVSCQ